MTIRETIQALTINLDKLSASDREFAVSLTSTAERQIKRDGTPSGKVITWLDTLARRATNPEPAPTVETPYMGKLFALLRGAVERSKGKLKYPKLVLHVGSDIVKVALVQRGKYAGKLKVACPTREGRYGDLWMGAIEDNGSWQLPRNVSDDNASLFNEVASLLVRLADDPAKTAKEQAEASKSNTDHVYGNCCFCGLPLSDDASTDVGYGSTCAKHYNLPHGRAPKRSRKAA